MNKIFVIAKKEFLDVFRDKRTLMRMILIPLVAFPLIIQLVTTLLNSQSEKQATKEMKIGYYLNGQSEAFINDIKSLPLYTFVPYDDSIAMRKDVMNDSLNLALRFTPSFDSDLSNGNKGHLDVIYRGADGEDLARFEEILDWKDSSFVAQRMISMGKDYSFVEPLEVRNWNQSSFKEIIGKYGGGLLPYIFMAFLFMGCMLPAIDLFAGEKERGTIETLLTSPVNRMQILMGKMIVVVCMGLISASVALIGLFASLNMMNSESDTMKLINEILTPQLIGMLFVLLIPLAIFFAGVMIPISVYSRSFKEAQSILTPLNIVMVLPAMAGFIPGIELDYTTAFIPIVNVVLATKALIAGNPDWILLAITFISLILLAGIAVFVAFKQFGKEDSILR